MKTTLAWLRTHLETTATLDELVAALVMLGLEVDGIEDRSKSLKPFTAAKVISAVQHPNADKLRVCMVETKDGQIQVVCGAPNARAGMVGVFAPVGSVIPRNGMELKEGTIRGEASRGMLCSAFEMGISDDHDGIIELPLDTPVGASFAQVAGLDDPVLDIKITPNRGDCLGVRGIARDLAAAGFGKLKPLDETPVPGTFKSPIHVHLAGPDAKACPLFVGRTIRNVKNGPSPRWLQDRLLAIGLRPISALVDITNFMTFDLNRPFHAFDAGKVSGDIVVRGARPGETVEALNGKTYTLDAEMTVVADDKGVQSMGGVIGSATSGCDENTTTVFLEAALFDSVRTAATGRKLNVQSDARYRFERGLDPAFVHTGMEIATRLVLELCGGEASEVTTSGAVPEWKRNYRFRPERTQTLGGVEVPGDDSRVVLETLGCTVEWATEGGFSVTPPPWRGDIIGEADLVEEVLRIRGYGQIPAIPMERETALPRVALSPAQRKVGFVRRALAARGLNEAVTYSFMPQVQAELFNGGSAALRVDNPISADLDAMRPSILPNLIVAAQRNADRGFPDLGLFEVGPQYANDTPEGQSLMATGLRAGRTGPKLWDDPGRATDVFMAKADALAALAAAGAPIENLQASADPPAWYHPGRAGCLRLGPKVIAYFGEIHPAILSKLDAKGPMAGFEIFLDEVPLPRAKAGRARPLLKLSAFQPVERDFAFVVDQDLSAAKLLNAARQADKKLVTGVRLFDVYQGKGLPEGKKSLAINVTLQPESATLTEAEIEGFSKRLVAAVEKATGGTLRG